MLVCHGIPTFEMGAKVNITLVIFTFAPIAKVDLPWDLHFRMDAKADITLVLSTFATVSDPMAGIA